MNKPERAAYTRRETATLLRVSLPTVDRMCRNGKLGTSKVGSVKLISAADVDAMLPRAVTE